MEASMELSRDREIIIKNYLELDDNDNKEKYKNKYNIISEELNRNEYLGSYSSFIGSPLHQGKRQFDLWNVNVTDIRHDWSGLMNKKYGVRNDLF